LPQYLQLASKNHYGEGLVVIKTMICRLCLPKKPSWDWLLGCGRYSFMQWDIGDLQQKPENIESNSAMTTRHINNIKIWHGKNNNKERNCNARSSNATVYDRA
jgi:hypothetical protein